MNLKRTWLWLWLGLITGVAIAASGALPAPTTNVTLAWNGVQNAAGYKVYYGPASGNYTNFCAVGNVTNATVYGLVNGAIYFFAVTSLSAAGMESVYSGEAMATAGSTNNYLIVQNVLKRHVRPLLGGFSLASTNWPVVLQFTNDDATGATSLARPWLAWGKETTNWPIATNTFILTNPPPDTGTVVAMMLAPFKPTVK